MTDKEKLAKVRTEIERRKKLHEKSLTNPIHEGFGLQKVIESKISELTYLLSFIDSMQEEPVSEDLEEAVNAYIGYAPEVDESSSTYGKRQAFKAGANWKEQQLMAKAVDAHCFGFQGAALFSFRLPADKYLVGSEVKVIVIKK